MGKSKKEVVPIRAKQETKLCLNCGFPNRESDKRCIYCKLSIVEEDSFVSWIRQTYYILRWRRQLKQISNKSAANKKSLLFRKHLGYFALGSILGGVGLYLFAKAITENSISSGLIAGLFMFYGFSTLRSLFVAK